MYPICELHPCFLLTAKMHFFPRNQHWFRWVLVKFRLLSTSHVVNTDMCYYSKKFQSDSPRHHWGSSSQSQHFLKFSIFEMLSESAGFDWFLMYWVFKDVPSYVHARIPLWFLSFNSAAGLHAWKFNLSILWRKRSFDHWFRHDSCWFEPFWTLNIANKVADNTFWKFHPNRATHLRNSEPQSQHFVKFWNFRNVVGINQFWLIPCVLSVQTCSFIQGHLDSSVIPEFQLCRGFARLKFWIFDFVTKAQFRPLIPSWFLLIRSTLNTEIS